MKATAVFKHEMALMSRFHTGYLSASMHDLSLKALVHVVDRGGRWPLVFTGPGGISDKLHPER